MKAIGVVLLILGLSGCGTFQTLEELEQEAMISGDWSAVEKRERIIAKRRSRSSSVCPAGQMNYCENWGATERCGCVRRDLLQNTLNRW